MTPPPLWQLVEQLREMEKAHRDNYAKMPDLQMFHALAEDCKYWGDAVAAALRAWDEHFHGNDPDIRESFVREQVLGVPPKEPATEKK